VLVTLFALVIRHIGIVRCGPLMTIIVPCVILQASPKAAPYTWGCDPTMQPTRRRCGFGHAAPSTAYGSVNLVVPRGRCRVN
jgi:hypothetical protein